MPTKTDHDANAGALQPPAKAGQFGRIVAPLAYMAVQWRGTVPPASVGLSALRVPGNPEIEGGKTGLYGRQALQHLGALFGLTPARDLHSVIFTLEPHATVSGKFSPSINTMDDFQNRYHIPISQARGDFRLYLLDLFRAWADKKRIPVPSAITAEVFRTFLCGNEAFISELLANPEWRHVNMISFYGRNSLLSHLGPIPLAVIRNGRVAEVVPQYSSPIAVDLDR